MKNTKKMTKTTRTTRFTSITKQAGVALLALLLAVSCVSCGASGAENAEMSPEWEWNDSYSDKSAIQGKPSQIPATGEVFDEMTEVFDEMTEGVMEAPAEEGVPETEMVKDEDVETDANAPVTVENPFISTTVSNVSTFSADVDTASYAYFRKLVNSGYSLKELTYSGTAFRTEEFINYFKYDVATPAEGELFGVTTEITPCPWNGEAVLLRLTLQAEKAKPVAGNNLVFLIDVSGSMSSADKLPLLKKAFSYLVGNLGENDVVSIVTYSGKEAVVLDGCQGSKGELILKAINSLEASGSTNGEAGLTRAYQLAEANYIEGGNNRIIMASDGDLNVGISSQKDLVSYIEAKRDQGVYLSVLGFGTGNYKDNKMEALADNGNGVYYYIDGESEAEKVMGTDIFGTLYTVAEDVKLQLTFSKERVEAYRLIGYENRMLNEEDFEDDTKDAGEVGASHQVTVCYELKLCDGAVEDPIVTLAVRYKNPGEPISMLNEYDLGDEICSNTMDGDMRFLTAVIETCMILRQSQYLGDVTIDSVLDDLYSLDLSAYPEREEFRELVKTLAQREG